MNTSILSKCLLAALLAASVLLSQAGFANNRCEKCSRGPDGKIECRPVPCPQK